LIIRSYCRFNAHRNDCISHLQSVSKAPSRSHNVTTVRNSQVRIRMKASLTTTKMTRSRLASGILMTAVMPFSNAQDMMNYTFAIVPKLTTNPFFDDVHAGCLTQVERIGSDMASCLYVGPEQFDAEAQAAILDDLVDQGDVDGIAVSSIDEEVTGAAINRAVAAGIPVVTFDSDAPDSDRLCYIGTDDVELGRSFAWLLAIARPFGGKYSIISSDAPNTNARVEGIRNELVESFPSSEWIEIGQPTNCEDSAELALEQAYEIGSNPNVTALVSVGGWPMFSDAEKWKEFVDKHPNLLLLVADTLPEQRALLEEGYVHALVGQRPNLMGAKSVEVLYDYITKNVTPPEVINTGEQLFISPDLDQGATKEPEADAASGRMQLGYYYWSLLCGGLVGLLFRDVF